MLDPSEFATSVPVQLTAVLWAEYRRWAELQDIRMEFAYGRVYFLSAQDAAAFCLRFDRGG